MPNKSALAALLCLPLLACGGHGPDAKNDQPLAKKAGAKAGEVLVDFASGVGAGADTKLMVPVELSAAVSGKNLTRTVAKSLGVAADSKGFTVYLISKDPFSGTLVAKAFDKDGAEIGRSRATVSFAADDAKYVVFTFDDHMDANMVAKYVVDLSLR